VERGLSQYDATHVLNITDVWKIPIGREVRTLSLSHYANPEVAVAPPPFSLGIAPPTLPNRRARGIELANLSRFKEFSLARFPEGLRLEYRAEAFNAFNHPHFCAPDTNVNDGTFGQIFATCPAGREVQMAVKLYVGPSNCRRHHSITPDSPGGS